MLSADWSRATLPLFLSRERPARKGHEKAGSQPDRDTQNTAVTESGTHALLAGKEDFPGTAAPYVQEMYYRIGGKPYFALAFRNDSGGYELRNPRFKGSTSKDITHIRQKGEPRDTCFVFEGFLDFLSFLTIRQRESPGMPCTDWQDYVILNSTANVDKALYPLAGYGHIHCMLDNDEAGRKAVEAIRQEYKWRVRDASHLYSGHNDLNDYLRSLKGKQSQDLTVTDKPQPEQDNRQNPGEKKKRGLRM